MCAVDRATVKSSLQSESRERRHKDRDLGVVDWVGRIRPTFSTGVRLMPDPVSLRE